MTASDIRIVPVTTKKQLHSLARFPWHIYRDDPNWVPPIYMDRLTLLNPEKHPFWEHAVGQYFLAMRGKDLVGTISAHVNHRHNKIHKDKVGFFGFFEVLDDDEATGALFGAAEDWLRGQGMEAIRGPENPSQNEECGLLVDGFDSPPVIMMTYNPRYYEGLIERAGFEKAQDLFAWILRASVFDLDPERLPRKFLRVADQARKKEGLVIRKINMKDYDHELELTKIVYNAAWEINWGFVPWTDHEIEHLGADLKMVIDPDLAYVALMNGEPVGISVGLPDVNQALLKAKPQPNIWSLPLTLAKFLWHRRKIDTFRSTIMGVVPEYRVLGIDALFAVDTARAAFAKGYKHIEMSWTLESNESVNRIAERVGGKLYKTYRIYEKPL